MLKRVFPTIRRWPKSMDQQLENPLQAERLPDTSAAELALPTLRHSPAEDRRYAGMMLLWACLVALPLVFFQASNLYGVWLALHISGLVSAGAAAVFAAAYLHWLPLPHRTAAAAAVGIAAIFVLFQDPAPRSQLALALAATLLLADLLARHLFWIRTAAHERERASRRRGLWSGRWNPFAAQVRGLELYWLGPMMIGAAFALYVRSEVELPTGAYLEHFPALGNVLLLLAVLPLVVEPLAAYVYRRPYVSPAAQLRAFHRALVSWFAYNRHGAQGPGVLQSPAGSHRTRRRLLFAVAALFAAAVAPQFNHGRDVIARTTVQPDYKRSPRDREDESQSEPESYPADGRPLAVRKEQVRRAEEQQLDAPSAAPAYAGAEELELSDTQQRLLARMDEASRERYLERLKRRAASAQELDALLAHEAAARAEHEAYKQQSQKWFDVLAMTAYFWAAWLAYPLLGLMLPVALSLTGVFAVAASAAGLADPSLAPPQEEDAEKGELSPARWETLVQRLRASRDAVERESLFLGLNAADRSPVIVPREVFGEHAHLLGDSGSGKTSLGLAPLIAQFIRFRDCSVVVVDLKADDLSLFEGARREAEAAGLRCRWFTNELGQPTYAFNPLMQEHFGKLSLYQRTDILTSALGLQYGTDYGRGYFSDANAELLHRAIQARPGARSFRELAATLADPHVMRGVSKELRRAGTHVVTVINRLAAHEALNVTSAGGHPASVVENAIDLAEVFREPQVVCFHLASALGTTTSAEMGRLALHSLLTAAKSVGPNRTQVYLVIDEFQRLVAGNLELFLQTARSMNIGVILANQTLMDLKGAGVDLIPTVRANTRFKQVFAASDLQEQQEVIQSSGETIVHNRSWTEYLGIGPFVGGVRSIASAETVTPRLRANDILLATDDPRQSIVQVRRGAGYAQYGGMPFVMTSTHHITFEEYSQRRSAAWPEAPGETLIARPDRAAPPLLPPPRGEGRSAPPSEPTLFPDPVLATPAPEEPLTPEAPPAPEEPPAPPVVAAPASDPKADPFEELWRSQQERKKRRRANPTSPPTDTPDQEDQA